MLDRLTDALVKQETLEDWEIRELLGFDKNSNSGDNPV